MGKSRWFLLLIGAILLGSGALAYFAQRGAAPTPGGRQPVARSALVPVSPLGRSSAALLPPALGGVFLGISEQQLVGLRPGARRQEVVDAMGHYAFGEGLSGGAQVLYLFDGATKLLARVQIAERLAGLDGVVARVEAMQRRYGAPSGVWDCPPAVGEGQLPTRRFSWTTGAAGVMDVILLIGERAAGTLYVASTGDLLDSLGNARCIPVPAERFNKFPAVPDLGSASP